MNVFFIIRANFFNSRSWNLLETTPLLALRLLLLLHTVISLLPSLLLHFSVKTVSFFLSLFLSLLIFASLSRRSEEPPALTCLPFFFAFSPLVCNTSSRSVSEVASKLWRPRLKRLPSKLRSTSSSVSSLTPSTATRRSSCESSSVTPPM